MNETHYHLFGLMQKKGGQKACVALPNRTKRIL